MPFEEYKRLVSSTDRIQAVGDQRAANALPLHITANADWTEDKDILQSTWSVEDRVCVEDMPD